MVTAISGTTPCYVQTPHIRNCLFLWLAGLDPPHPLPVAVALALCLPLLRATLHLTISHLIASSPIPYWALTTVSHSQGGSNPSPCSTASYPPSFWTWPASFRHWTSYLSAYLYDFFVSPWVQQSPTYTSIQNSEINLECTKDITEGDYGHGIRKMTPKTAFLSNSKFCLKTKRRNKSI